jgi:hypothetical protein
MGDAGEGAKTEVPAEVPRSKVGPCAGGREKEGVPFIAVTERSQCCVVSSKHSRTTVARHYTKVPPTPPTSAEYAKAHKPFAPLPKVGALRSSPSPSSPPPPPLVLLSSSSSLLPASSF